MGSFPPLTRLKALITGGNPIRIISYKSYKSAKKSPYPAVAGLPNKDSGVRLWGFEPQTPR